MILECTECRARYLVPDTAIGLHGRTVRCASCKHSWFQPAAPVLDLVARAQAPGAGMTKLAPAPPTASPFAAAAEESAAAAVPPSFDPTDPVDAFTHQPPFRPRRNQARRRAIVAVAAGAIMLAAAGTLLYLGAPGLAATLGLQQWGFGLAEAETPLLIVTKPVDHHDLANGNEYFAISGTISNPTAASQPVPAIRAELQDAQERPVYSWTIRPNVLLLPPHEHVEFASAQLNVPVNAKRVVLSFSGETSP